MMRPARRSPPRRRGAAWSGGEWSRPWPRSVGPTTSGPPRTRRGRGPASAPTGGPAAAGEGVRAAARGGRAGRGGGGGGEGRGGGGGEGGGGGRGGAGGWLGGMTGGHEAVLREVVRRAGGGGARQPARDVRPAPARGREPERRAAAAHA